MNYNILLASIAFFLASLILEEYQDEFLEELNEYLPSIFNSPSDSIPVQRTYNQGKEAVELLDVYRQILQQSESEDQNCEISSQNNTVTNCNLYFRDISRFEMCSNIRELIKQLPILSTDIGDDFYHSIKLKREIHELYLVCYLVEIEEGEEIPNVNIFKDISEAIKQLSKHQCSKEESISIKMQALIKKEQSNVISDSETLLFHFEKNGINQQIDIVSFVGLEQLNNKNNAEEVINRLTQEILYFQSLGTKVHIEMDAIKNEKVLEQLVTGPLLAADSIGLNEQELVNLLTWLEDNTIAEQEYQQEMEYNELISKVIQLISQFKQYEIKIQRVHVHGVEMQMICNNVNQWEESKLSLIHSVLVQVENLEIQSENELNQQLQANVPQEIELPFLNEKLNINLEYNTSNNSQFTHSSKIEFDINDPIVCWNPLKNIQCCLTPSIKIINFENISKLEEQILAASLIYHKSK